MNAVFATLALIILLLPLAGFAAPREDLLSPYTASARATSPSFSGFSASRGEKLYFTEFRGGKPETPSCASCHGEDPRSAGRTPTGKVIDAVAISVTPTRYADPAKLEKWFKRNCNDVLGRECTALEKGDWLSYMLNQ